MKKIMLSLLVLSLVCVSNAQTKEKKVFVPNFYLGLYGGLNAFVGEGNALFKSPSTFSFKNNVRWGSALALGYDFTPVFGMRGEIGYAQNKWKNLNRVNQIDKFWFESLTADLMFNMSNLFWGYNPARRLDVQLFAGGGVGNTGYINNSKGDRITPIVRAGIQGLYHLNRNLDLNLDLATNAVSDKYNDLKVNCFFDDVSSVMLGLVYHFKGVVEEQPAPMPLPEPVKVVEKPLDTDGDGIIDSEDKCPTVAGVAKYQGCPVPDTDGDGIDDERDKCPTVRGVARYQGCPIPDTDGDGVNDEEDKCPNVAGPKENHGCPVVKADVVKKINLTAKNIFFVTGKSELKPVSKTQLMEIVKIMNEDKNIKLSVNGYTDNVGSVDSNQKLSEERANAVRDFLMAKGIAAERMRAQGFGVTNPVASNATAAGRQQNRRVELIPAYAF
jgi:outer membrane protein OmpA-like peptidoglycan-associated protein